MSDPVYPPPDPEQPTEVQDAQDGLAPSATEALTPDPHAPAPEGLAPAADAATGDTVDYGTYDEDEDWLDEPGELPRRPRRRLLSPLPLALLGALLIACGFIAGVLVEKGQGGSSTAGGSAASVASRFASLRRGTAGASGASSGAGASGAAAAGGSGLTRPTSGQVAYLSGNTLYVTNAEGNTVKVTTSNATAVTKSVSSTIAGIHPGETVTVTGSAGSSGAVAAESITVGSSAGGLAALFGGGSRGGSGAGTGTGTGSGAPALFGN